MPDNTTVFDKPITDKWIHVELNLPQGDLFWIGKVISRIKHGSCDATRSFYSKPFLNALTYDVEFSDGEIKQFLDNFIDENLYSQVDEDGHNIQILDYHVDYRNDSNAFNKAELCLPTKSVKQLLRRKTTGQSLLTLCKNKEEEWMLLNQLKQFLPLEIAEFTVSR